MLYKQKRLIFYNFQESAKLLYLSKRQQITKSCLFCVRNYFIYSASIILLEDTEVHDIYLLFTLANYTIEFVITMEISRSTSIRIMI